ncbi:embryo defective [Thalictrum thalictroides]|uniref:Embryo defective n=1 Tax=Thalictrum thalictroides TaxID=46969 RepID=A0A7J6VMP1_THATH|nr:embryo defective [Thalictrum thalictroides]
MATNLWKRYAEYLHTKWEKMYFWDSIEHYRRPKTFTRVVVLYASAFYTGVVGAAITEQHHKEKYWEEQPGKAVSVMKA